MAHRKKVAYFDGTEPALLTTLICNGCDTVPVSNGRDNHGPHVRLINDQNRFDLLLAPLYKIVAPEDREPTDATYQDIFHLCRTYSIPMLVAVPAALCEAATALVGELPASVQMVDPAEMERVALEVLAD
jgi:hypothetical protein